MPHRRELFEQPELRAALWRMVITMLKTVHQARFPKKRRFGTDTQLLMVYGAALTLFLEGRSPRASSVSRLLDMPHETARRHLKAVQALGLLEREDHNFIPSIRFRAFDLDKVERLLQQAAKNLF